jgi:hypothetical protein
VTLQTCHSLHFHLANPVCNFAWTTLIFWLFPNHASPSHRSGFGNTVPYNGITFSLLFSPGLFNSLCRTHKKYLLFVFFSDFYGRHHCSFLFVPTAFAEIWVIGLSLFPKRTELLGSKEHYFTQHLAQCWHLSSNVQQIGFESRDKWENEFIIAQLVGVFITYFIKWLGLISVMWKYP